MPALIDLTGRRLGLLTVLGRAENANNGHARWECVCVCGGTTVAVGSHLRSGHTTSCGCNQKDQASEANTKPADQIGYHAAHQRVRRTRGPASGYGCSDCLDDAVDWSLTREACETFIEEINGYSLKFSADPRDYDPRCRNCHATYDRE